MCYIHSLIYFFVFHINVIIFIDKTYHGILPLVYHLPTSLWFFLFIHLCISSRLLFMRKCSYFKLFIIMWLLLIHVYFRVRSFVRFFIDFFVFYSIALTLREYDIINRCMFQRGTLVILCILFTNSWSVAFPADRWAFCRNLTTVG